jgi:AraC-like DNA-binding protein
MSTQTPVAVPGTLRRWISGVTVLTAGGPAGCPALVHVPDADISLVFRTTPAGRGDLIVTGPRTCASYHAGKDFLFCLRIRLRPGAAPFLLGIPAGELADQVISASELREGPHALEAALAASADDPVLAVKHLEAAVLARIATRTAADISRSQLVQTAASSLAGRPGHKPQSLPAVARRLAISERHLRTVFSDFVGLSPKRYQRISRVRRVLAGGRSGPSGWAQLAATVGYFDQSHMAAEFRSMMGVPPAAFFAGHLPPLQPC